MTKHEIILYWSADDDSFIAEVPELPGCVADGDTRQEALTDVEIVIQEWIATAEEVGRSIPEPKGTGVVRLTGGPVMLRSTRMDVVIQIEELPEGSFLATSEEVPGLVAQGRTVAETLEIARDVARNLNRSTPLSSRHRP